MFKKTKEATFLLKGGLGNQLFQVAAGINHSIINDVVVKFDTSWFQKSKGIKVAIQDFAIPLDEFHVWEVVPELETLSYNFVESKNRFTPSLVMEEQMSFSPMVQNKGLLIYDGYWQSELFFRDINVQLRNYLRSSLPSSAIFSEYNLHIRRGDFLKAPFKEVHNILSAEYYQRAIKLLNLDSGLTWTAITQNSSELEPELLNLLNENKIKIYAGNTNLEDISILASSKRIIIANSTFSWWGAYLSRSEEVVAPRNWFTKEHLRSKNVCDLFPEDWILI